MGSAPGSMRACALVEPGRLELLDLPEPELGARDVLLRPSAVGVCGTDFHIFAGEANYHLDPSGRPIPLSVAPQVLGHEIVGEVLAVGREVRDLEAGATVVLDQGRNCHSAGRTPLCGSCAWDASHQCDHYAEHGISGLPGGFAERLAIPAVNALRVEGDLAPEAAALTEPLACVLHTLQLVERAWARFRFRDPDPGRRVRSVLVQGAGPAGLLFVQALREVLDFQGALLVSEPNAAKRARAAALGCTVLDPAADLVTAVAELTEGRGVELLVEASGAGAALAQASQLIRKQATLVKYGVGHHGEGLERLNELQWKEPTFLLPVGASSGFDPDGRPTGYRRALELIATGRVRAAELVTHRYRGLEAVPDAFGGDHRADDYLKGVALL